MTVIILLEGTSQEIDVIHIRHDNKANSDIWGWELLICVFALELSMLFFVVVLAVLSQWDVRDGFHRRLIMLANVNEASLGD